MSRKIDFRKSLDLKAKVLKPNLAPLPKLGWVRSVREALAMTQSDLAKRIGVNQRTIHALEMSEINQKIQIGSLQKLADAMNCDFYYAFVPRKTLEHSYKEQARQNAIEHLARIENTMVLERQKMKFPNSRIEEIMEELVETERVKW